MICLKLKFIFHCFKQIAKWKKNNDALNMHMQVLFLNSVKCCVKQSSHLTLHKKSIGQKIKIFNFDKWFKNQNQDFSFPFIISECINKLKTTFQFSRNSSN